MPKSSDKKLEYNREYRKRTGYASQHKYNQENTIPFSFRMMKNTEQDIIDKLNSVPSKAGYIKQLIRDDIAKEKITQSNNDEQ